MSKERVVVSAPLFDLGRVVATPGALSLLAESRVNFVDLLNRHVRGDWGDVCAEDGKLNDVAVHRGERLLSFYALGCESRNSVIWVITEADRSSTCCLLPSEY